METFSRKVDRVIDCHVHLRDLASLGNLKEIRRRVGLDRINLAGIVDPRTGAGHAQGLCAKADAPGAFYCFGGLNHAAALSGGEVRPPSLAEQVGRLISAGCDGIKLIAGKPTSRRKLPVALDGDYYREFFARAEADDVPLLWHVADPEEFWDPQRAPAFAVKQGWVYGPDDVPKEQLYREVDAVLARHPNLRVILAHFYFLSADLPRAERFLGEHPNVHLDLALGIELLFNLSRRPAEAREFFIAHQDRIFFGTDIGSPAEPDQAAARADLLRRFLETDETFTVPGRADHLLEPGGSAEVHGLDLPVEALARIYRGNFESFAGAEPKKVDPDRALAECRLQADIAAQMSGVDAARTEAGRCAEALEGMTRSPTGRG